MTFTRTLNNTMIPVLISTDCIRFNFVFPDYGNELHHNFCELLSFRLLFAGPDQFQLLC